MSHAPNPKAAEILATLNVGAAITIRHKNQETAAKLRAKWVPGSAKFQCVIPGTGGGIVWCELHQLVADGVEAPVAPQPVAVAKKAKLKVSFPQISDEVMEASTNLTEAQLAKVLPVAMGEPAPERPKVSEMGQRILAAVAANGGPMLATAIAVALDEKMLRVAGLFGVLVKAGLIESHGGENKKGGKTIELTAAGYEYVAPESFVDAGEPTEAEAGEALPEVPFECTTAHVLAMESLLPDGMDVADIFVANLLTDLEGRHPWPVVKTPARLNPDAYFYAALSGDGEEYVVFMRDLLRMGPRPEPSVVTGKLSAAHIGQITKEATRARRSGAQKARHEPRGTGRAGGARKSLPELVMGEFVVYANTDKMSYKEATKAAATKLGLAITQVQNAAFKLAKSGFLATGEDGKVANPLALTERGRGGYTTNHGANLRPLIEAAIAEGLTNDAVAQRVGCALSYVHDVRTKRPTGYAFKKLKKEAATA